MAKPAKHRQQFIANLGQQIESTKHNNLNAIRLCLALFVILSHSFPLSLSIDPYRHEPLACWTHQQESFGSLAVDLFFFISGMLITASWFRSKSMQDYLRSRVLRIYPAFIAAVGLSGLIVLISCPEFRRGIGHGISWALIMVRDWCFLTYNSLDQNGIFMHNPFPKVADGSLWTIQTEFRCYLLVALIGLLYLFKRRFLILLASLVTFLIYSKILLDGDNPDHSDNRFFCFFAFGMLAWLWRDKIAFSKWIAAGCGMTLVVASQFKPWFSILLPVCGGYCVLYLGYGFRLTLMEWTRRTDISYGTYLYAFPIQQLVAMHEPLRDPWINVLISTPVTILVGFASWFLVEKRFLAMKHLPRSDYDPGSTGGV